MRILHVTKKYPNAIGGDSVVVKNLEECQIINGDEVYILTSNCDEIQNKDNVIKFGLKDSPANQDYISAKRIFSLFILFINSFKLIKDLKPNVVHSHSCDLGVALSFSCKLNKVPIINTCHGVSFNDSQYSFFKRKLEIFLLRLGSFNKIITVDKNSLDSFVKNKINNVIYVPNGVNLTNFIKKREFRKSKVLKVIFVGRLEDQKGLIYLFDAVNKLKNENFILSIIGTGSLESKLKEIVKNYGLKNKIVFLGSKTNKETIDELYNSDIFILPSIWEGFPLTILEAWAARLPIIVTNVGGISNICKNLENSLIISPKSANKIRDAIYTLINNKKLRNTLALNGRKMVEDKYSWKTVSGKIKAIYDEVLI